MSTFELTTPDGSKYQIDADSPELAQQAFDHAFGGNAAQPSSGGVGTALANAGKFLGTAAVNAGSGFMDWVTDPLSPIRRMIDPRLEDMEQSIRPHPGQAARNAVFAAAPDLEYKPGGALDRTALAATSGLIAGAPFGLAGALYGGASGLLGQGTQELTGSERLGTAATFLPGLLGPPIRGAANMVASRAGETFGPALSKSYREGMVGEQLRSGASDLDALRSSLMVDQPGPLAQSLIPDSLPTTFQLSGDMGIGQMERAARTRDAAPFLDRAAEQNQARVGQLQSVAPENAAPSAMRDLLQQRLAAIDAEGEANIKAAQQNAQQAYAMAGGQGSPELYGQLMRDQLEAAKTAAKQNEGRLWQAIDPDGTLTIGGGDVRAAGKRIASDIPELARPPEGEEAAILGATQTLPDTLPFGEMAALRSRLLSAIRQERATNGETPALRRMQMLRGAVEDTISGAAEQAAQNDAGLLGRLTGDLSDIGTAAQSGAVAGGYNGGGASAISSRGTSAPSGMAGAAGYPARGFGGSAGRTGISQPPPKPQDIVEFLISRGGVRDDGGELRAMDTNRVNGGYGTGGVGRGAFGILSRKNGMPPDTAREAAEEAGYLKPGSTISDLYDAIHDSTRGIPHYSDRDADIVENWDYYQKTGEVPPAPEMPALPPNFDQAAADRYRAAAAATAERAATFKSREVGPVLQTRGTAGDYRLPNSAVPQKFLSSTESVDAFLRAGGDAATMRDALVNELRQRATDVDGNIKPTSFQSWRNGRQAALRAFPEVDRQLGDAAQAQQAVDIATAAARQQRLDFEKGAARHFLNAEPEKAVQSALGSKTPVADFQELARLVGGDQDAKSGLQRAVADYIARNYIGSTEAGTSGLGTIKSDSLQTFVNRNYKPLSQIFSADQMKTMRAIAADLQRSNRSIASSKIPGQSNTAQDMALQGGSGSLLRRHFGDLASSAAGAVTGYLLTGRISGALAGSYAGLVKAALDRMKAAGIERTDQLMTEALLNPELARTLLTKPNPASQPYIARRLRTSFGRIAAGAAARQDADNRRQ